MLIILCLAIFIYVAAALCFNQTILTVDDNGLKWNYSPIPFGRGGQVGKQQIKAITYKCLNKSAYGRTKAHFFHSLGVKGIEKVQVIIFYVMQSAWTAEMTARVIAGYLGDVPVESD